VLLLAITGLCYAAHRTRTVRMEATAFVRHSTPTAAGTVPHNGIVAADPALLPLGSIIRIADAGAYDGVYTVTDTGSKIVGRHIDICVRTAAAARRFGKRNVLVRLLRIGSGKQEAREEDIPAIARRR